MVKCDLKLIELIIHYLTIGTCDNVCTMPFKPTEESKMQVESMARALAYVARSSTPRAESVQTTGNVRANTWLWRHGYLTLECRPGDNLRCGSTELCQATSPRDVTSPTISGSPGSECSPRVYHSHSRLQYPLHFVA